MKILLVNRYGYPKYGSETYFLNLCRLLKKKGHKVIVFTIKDERNIYREYIDYYVNKIDVDNLDSISLLDKISLAPKTIYSFEAKRKLKKLIRDTRPDIVHLHNIKRLISPSILHSIKKFSLPVVYTLNDYHPICPNYRLFSKGKICQDCKGSKYYFAFLKKCVRNSFFLSFLACIEQYAHNMLKIFKNNVDMFIAPSNFLRQKMIEYGFNPNKLVCIPYFLFVDEYQPKYEYNNYIVYIGRLVREKGIMTVVNAICKLPSVRLLIVGEGVCRKDLEKLVIKKGINNIEFKGYMPSGEIKAVIGNAMFVVVPSEWYEVYPMVIIESFAMGKPVIGASTGGIPELIDNGVNGLLYQSGDTDDLIDKIAFFLKHKDSIFEMGKNARKKALEYYNADHHYEKILALYQKLIIKR